MAEIKKCLGCGCETDRWEYDALGVPTCPYCGRKYKKEVGSYDADLQKIVSLRQLRNFREAEEMCRELIDRNPESCEAYWQMLLIQLGVVYVSDENGIIGRGKGGRVKPTFFCYSYSERERVQDSRYYRKALELSPTAEDRGYYEAHAQELDLLLKEFFSLVARESSYDIFISFKRTRRITYAGKEELDDTRDYKRAKEIYEFLSKQYKVFFSPVSIGKDTGIEGEKYEPRILKALQTAQAMILLGSETDYITGSDAKWVENEWRRYLYFIEKGFKSKKSLIYGYIEHMPPLPKALSDIQLPTFDMSRGTYLQYLESKISPVVKSSVGFKSVFRKTFAAELIQSDEGEFNLGYSAERITFTSTGKNVTIRIPATEERDMATAEEMRQRGHFSDAVKRYSMIIKKNPENARAYWYRFCSQVHARADHVLSEGFFKAKPAHYADVEMALQKAPDEAFYWHIIDSLIGCYKNVNAEWSAFRTLSSCLFKYVNEERSVHVLEKLEQQYQFYLKKQNVKAAEEIFAEARKLFFEGNLDYNILFMRRYAVALFEKGEYELARKYFEELASARKSAEIYLYLLKCRVRTNDLEHTKFRLHVDSSDLASAKKPSELELDEIIERIILCNPLRDIMDVLKKTVMYQIAYNRRHAKDFIITVASCIKNNSSFLAEIVNSCPVCGAAASRMVYDAHYSLRCPVCSKAFKDYRYDNDHSIVSFLPLSEEAKCKCGEALPTDDTEGIFRCSKCGKPYKRYRKNGELIVFLLEVANRYIQCKDFKGAALYYTEVINLDANTAKAHWGLLKCRLKAFDDYDLIKKRKNLNDLEEFNNALNSATNEEYREFMAIYDLQKTHNTASHARINKSVWYDLTRKRRTVVKIFVTLGVMALIAAGIVIGIAFLDSHSSRTRIEQPHGSRITALLTENAQD